jgi:hypothetical protein
MKWNEQVSPTVRRWFFIGVAFVIALGLLNVCTSSAQAAVVTQEGAADPAPPPQNFSIQAQVDTQSRSTGPCWYWRSPDSWGTRDHIGKLQYLFGIEIQWCANAARTKVTQLVYHFCQDRGGYYNFQWCHKDKGGLGYESLGLYDSWKYTYGLDSLGLSVTRTPSVRFSVHANGGVNGTVYFDD